MDPRLEEAYRRWLQDKGPTISEHIPYLEDAMRRLSGRKLVNPTQQDKINRIDGPANRAFQLLLHFDTFGFGKVDDIIECFAATDNELAARLFADGKQYCLTAIAPAPSVAGLDFDLLDGLEYPLVVKVKKLQQQQRPDQGRGETYPMTSSPRGFALIINNRVFANPDRDRPGSEEDYRIMRELCEQLNYKVVPYENINQSDMPKILTDFKKKFVSTQVDSCIVCIMSHGNFCSIEMADSKGLNYWNDLIYQFDSTRFPCFKDKPKIFIIAACATVPAEDETGTSQPPPPPSRAAVPRQYENPDMANSLVCTATSPGATARRNKVKGTWYINCLTQIIMNEAWRSEARQLFETMVQAGMQNVKADMKPEDNQLPLCIAMRFNKKFYFNPVQ